MTIALVIAHATAGGNPAGLSLADVDALMFALPGDTRTELSHAAHIHPTFDRLGSMCPVCDPETYALIILDRPDDAAEFAASYRREN